MMSFALDAKYLVMFMSINNDAQVFLRSALFPRYKNTAPFALILLSILTTGAILPASIYFNPNMDMHLHAQWSVGWIY